MSTFNVPRFIVAGASSDVGKTTFTIGLMAAYKKRGLEIQGYKVGPDYIDPSYHTAITGRVSRNLDTWMTSEDTMKEIFHRGCEGVDLAIIEGVMGLYDGKNPLSNKNSSAEISMLLKTPVILIISARGIARSAAAIVFGYQNFCPELNIAGVIVNRVGSKKHFKLLKDVIEHECKVPVLGYLEKDSDIVMPARHLGLIPALERGELNPLFDRLADTFNETIDLDNLLEIAKKAPKLEYPKVDFFKKPEDELEEVNIAVAKDQAFNFYYPENIDLLEIAGAKIHYFSPLNDEKLPNNIDALYIGGGYPEEFAARLAENILLKKEIKHSIDNGLPTFAECGGYMYLAESIIDHEEKRYEMVGVIPAEVTMKYKLIALGYREITALSDNLLLDKGEKARGHEFHYSTLESSNDEYPFAYEVSGLRGKSFDGYNKDNLLAGYTHLHFASNIHLVERYIKMAREYKNLIKKN